MARRWYIIQTYSGSENSVEKELRTRIQTMGFSDIILDVLNPEEKKIVTNKKGEKKEKIEKLYPGYLFIEIEVEDEVDEKAWFMIRNTPRVTGFIGSSGKGAKPTPVPRDDMNKILMKLNKISKPTFDFKVGDKILVTSGTFANQEYEIVSINEAKEQVTVLMDLFGRQTPTDFSYDQIKKVEA